jgi:hypothetical protein
VTVRLASTPTLIRKEIIERDTSRARKEASAAAIAAKTQNTLTEKVTVTVRARRPGRERNLNPAVTRTYSF